MMNEATRQFVSQHADDDVRLLALQAHATAGIDLPWALDQIRGRQVAQRKVPSWAAVDGIVYPPHLSMEQCSSEPTARYKAQLVRRLLDGAAPSPVPLFADLTGGFGVDFSLMAQAARGWRTVYVERNPQLCDLARHNLPLLGLGDAEVVCATADEFLAARLQEGVGDCLFYLDPARRDDHGGRTYALADCSPNVLELLGKVTKYQGNKVTKYQGNKEPRACSISEQSGERTKYQGTTSLLAFGAKRRKNKVPRYQGGRRRVLLKLSPMLDWRKAVGDLGPQTVSEVHIVSVQNECKELLVLLEPGAPAVCAPDGGDDEARTTAPITLCCVNDDQAFRLPSTAADCAALPYGRPEAGQLLMEPNASIMKAGCFGALSQRFRLAPLARDSHLFVPSAAPDGASGGEGGAFPGRVFRIGAVTTMGKRELRHALQGIDRANIATRNFPLKADELRRRLKLRDGGDTYIFGTTLADGSHVLIVCRKAEEQKNF